jgi:phospholipid/cholesterol/gamma-HCH transport system substrate-binding protein
MSAFRAGVLALVVIVVAAYFGFSRANPFANPYELHAVVRDAQNLKPGAPVRTAGVEVGKVTGVEAAGDGEQAARVTMELREDALPIHRDATLQIRPRILLEGNFFVDLEPGSGSARELADGSTLPIRQTTTSVTLPDILRVLDRDTRDDLRTLLREYATGLNGGGAEALNRTIPAMAPAYRLGALTNDALLGQQPTRDLQRVLRAQQRVAGALAANPGELKQLITDLNATAGAIASQDAALAASVPALRDTLREGYPALGELNDALPALRAFSLEALPGVRSSVPTLDAAIPWIVQARALVQESELKGTAADLRQAVPSLVTLNRRLIPALRQLRSLSACTSNVLVPFVESPIPSIEAANSGQLVRSQIMRSFVGLAGESRVNDANTPVFHIQGVSPLNLTAGRIEPAAPPDPNMPPEHRPDVPCESQEPPNLQAPSGSALDPVLTSRTVAP